MIRMKPPLCSRPEISPTTTKTASALPISAPKFWP